VAVRRGAPSSKANRDVEQWLRAVMAPLETQVREHQLQLKRRLESVKRIHQATDTLEDRVRRTASRRKIAGRAGRASSKALANASSTARNRPDEVPLAAPCAA
jgi:hypothetical protein